MTSLSCQFFCSAFVMAKDLCASSFVSDLRCQRCPFDVECRPHTRHHLCISRSEPVSVLACLHMCEKLHVGVDFCVCLHCSMLACVIMSVCVIRHLELLSQREQNGRWNITACLLFPYLMAPVIVTVWCSLAECVTAFDLSNTTHKFRKHSVCVTFTQRNTISKRLAETLHYCPVCHHASSGWPQWKSVKRDNGVDVHKE